MPNPSQFACHNGKREISPTAINYKGDNKMNFDGHWEFHLGDAANAQNVDFDDSSWRTLDLPHDWSIELPLNPNSPSKSSGGFLDGGIGWYRKAFVLPQEISDKKVAIEFDGIYMNSEVWINGHDLGVHPYGYTSFYYDLTPYLNFEGMNVVAVKVDNNQPNSRWYSGSGIYRNVWLKITDLVHVDQWGTYITTPKIIANPDSTYSAEVDLTTIVVNSSENKRIVTLLSTVLDGSKNAVATTSTSNDIDAGKSCKFVQAMNVADAKLWSVDQPTLYTLRTEVSINGTVVDSEETPFGIRFFKFDPNNGFSLNGKDIKLHGVCLHCDYGSLGSVVNIAAIDRELGILKLMGVNAIRTSHNPPAPEFLDEADRLGFLVIDEAFDCWNIEKTENDYHLYFDEWSKTDIQSMVNRDKNHPSVILWSIGNEIDESWTSAGPEIAQKLIDYIKAIDTTRPVTEAVAYWHQPNSYTNEMENELDVVGYNYGESFYDIDHVAYPNRIIFGSENCSAYSARGIYHTPIDQNITQTPDMLASSYGNSWAFSSNEYAWKMDKDRKNVAGEFVWTGFDYLGEPSPYFKWPEKSSSFGLVDTTGIPKDIYYFYKSQWTDTPTVHIVPQSWNYQQAQTIPVIIYTNAATVELLLNGKSLGTQAYDSNGNALHLTWSVAYQPGILEAVAKDKNGSVIATDEVKTAGKPSNIRLTSDRSMIKSDGKDLVYIEADIVDKDGNVVPDADNLINFTITGGKIVGVDNGNPIDTSSYKGTERKAFNGKCMVIVQSSTTSGKITAAASSAGSRPRLLYSNTVNVFMEPEMDGISGLTL